MAKINFSMYSGCVGISKSAWAVALGLQTETSGAVDLTNTMF